MSVDEVVCPAHSDPLDPGKREDPFGLFAEMRTERPVFYSEARGIWVVTRYEDVKRVLTDPDTFSSRGALRSARAQPAPEVLEVLREGYEEMPLLVDTDGAQHRRIRSLVNRAFTPRFVAELEPAIETCAEELIEGFAADGRADLIESFAWPFPLRNIGDMLGIPHEDLEQLHRWSQDWLLLYQDAGSTEDQVQHARSTVAMQRYFSDLLEERERDPGDDLVSALVRARQEGDEQLTEEEAVGIPLDLLVAGHVTVTRAIGSAAMRLIRHPDAAARLRAEPELLQSAVEEVLRLESPAQGLFREATRDVELGGAHIPAGARLMVHFGSANRDEDVFGSPADFEPARTDLGKHVAFGHGPHFCLGAPLARIEVRIALRLIVERLPGLRLQDVAEPYVYDPVFFARGFDKLLVEWDPA